MSLSLGSKYNIVPITIAGVLFSNMVLPSHWGEVPLRTAGMAAVTVAAFCVLYTWMRAQIRLPIWGYGVGMVLIPAVLFIARHVAMQGA